MSAQTVAETALVGDTVSGDILDHLSQCRCVMMVMKMMLMRMALMLMIPLSNWPKYHQVIVAERDVFHGRPFLG